MNDLSQKTFNQVTGVIFSLGALIHLLRLVYGWEANLGTWVAPIWLSVIGVLVAGYLAYSAYKLAK